MLKTRAGDPTEDGKGAAHAAPVRFRRFLRRQEVSDRTGLPTSSIYELMANGRFPKPVRLGMKAVGWLEDEVIAWQDERIAARVVA